MQRVIVDCAAGSAPQVVEFSDEEIAAHLALQEQLTNQQAYREQQQREAAARRQAAIDTLAAHLPPEGVAALLTLIG